MSYYIGLKHFTYAGIRVEPGLVFPKLAVRTNLILEQRGFVEIFHGREEDLVPCQDCPAKFVELHYMQNHMDRVVHKSGKVVSDESGIRTPEQEAELDRVVASMGREGPGVRDATPAGVMRESKRKRR